MDVLLGQTGALLFLIGWGIAAGGFIAWKGSRQLETAVTLARMVDRQESGRTGEMAYKSGLLANLLGTLLLAVGAIGWLPGVLASLLFGLGSEQVGSAPLQVVLLASTAPLTVGAIYRWQWKKRYRAAHTAYCPHCRRLNDRPHFPGHHRYQVIYGYAAILDGDGHRCRWCQRPMTFPRLDA